VLDGDIDPTMARERESGEKLCPLYNTGTADWISILSAMETLGDPKHTVLVY